MCTGDDVADDTAETPLFARTRTDGRVVRESQARISRAFPQFGKSATILGTFMINSKRGRYTFLGFWTKFHADSHKWYCSYAEVPLLRIKDKTITSCLSLSSWRYSSAEMRIFSANYVVLHHFSIAVPTDLSTFTCLVRYPIYSVTWKFCPFTAFYGTTLQISTMIRKVRP